MGRPGRRQQAVRHQPLDRTACAGTISVGRFHVNGIECRHLRKLTWRPLDFEHDDSRPFAEVRTSDAHLRPACGREVLACVPRARASLAAARSRRGIMSLSSVFRRAALPQPVLNSPGGPDQPLHLVAAPVVHQFVPLERREHVGVAKRSLDKGRKVGRA